MRKSIAVTLVLSGSLLAGCGKRDSTLSDGEGPLLTNNTYAPGQGYYHAPYRQWFPMPYNHYVPSLGYYHGGAWSSTPDASPTTATRPESLASKGAASSKPSTPHSSFFSRGGFGFHGSSIS